MAELINSVSLLSPGNHRIAYERILLPDPAKTEKQLNRHDRLTGQEKLTIATDPQQRTVVLPVTKCTTLDKPVCGSVVMGVTCGVMIDRRIRRSEPCSELLSGLVPYERISATIINDGKYQ